MPQSDDEALAALEGSPHTQVCMETYREWRALGASISAALIRAGEAAKEERNWGRHLSRPVFRPVRGGLLLLSA